MLCQRFPSWFIMGVVSLLLLSLIAIPLVYISNEDAQSLFLAITAPLSTVLYAVVYYLLVGRNLYVLSEKIEAKKGNTAPTMYAKELHRIEKAVQRAATHNMRISRELREFMPDQGGGGVAGGASSPQPALMSPQAGMRKSLGLGGLGGGSPALGLGASPRRVLLDDEQDVMSREVDTLNKAKSSNPVAPKASAANDTRTNPIQDSLTLYDTSYCYDDQENNTVDSNNNAIEEENDEEEEVEYFEEEEEGIAADDGAHRGASSAPYGDVVTVDQQRQQQEESRQRTSGTVTFASYERNISYKTALSDNYEEGA